MQNRRLTLIDLLVLTAVLIFFAGGAVLLADGDRETARRVECASHLKQIGQAILLYANENRGAYPRATYDPAKADKPTAYTHPTAKVTDAEIAAHIPPTFCKAGPEANDITAAIYLLILTEPLPPDVFTCPSARASATTQPSVMQHVEGQCNFSPGQLDYSFINVYPSDAAIEAGYKADVSMSAECAIAADMNPGVDELLTVTPASSDDVIKTVNSPNHGGECQNVLYADGHVEVQNTPFCGVARDNIYTYGKSGPTSGGEGIIGSPTGQGDTILLPTAKQSKPK